MAEILYVANEGEWAYVVADDETGLFSATTSFGTFSHIWSSRGPYTMAEFLNKVNYDYFMNKTRGLKAEEFDCLSSIDSMVSDIRTFMAESVGNAIKNYDDLNVALIDEAKEAIRYLKDFKDTPVNDSTAFFYELLESGYDFDAFLGGDWKYHYMKTMPSSECRGFWEKLWPAVLEKMNTPAPQKPTI